jgi:hypothetical protein
MKSFRENLVSSSSTENLPFFLLVGLVGRPETPDHHSLVRNGNYSIIVFCSCGENVFLVHSPLVFRRRVSEFQSKKWGLGYSGLSTSLHPECQCSPLLQVYEAVESASCFSSLNSTFQQILSGDSDPRYLPSSPRS